MLLTPAGLAVGRWSADLYIILPMRKEIVMLRFFYMLAVEPRLAALEGLGHSSVLVPQGHSSVLVPQGHSSVLECLCDTCDS